MNLYKLKQGAREEIVNIIYGMNIDCSMKEAKRVYKEIENSPLVDKLVDHIATTLTDEMVEIIKDMKQLEAIKKAVAELYCASGCSCCRDEKGWDKASEELAKLLDIPAYDDGSGFDFYSVRDSYKEK